MKKFVLRLFLFLLPFEIILVAYVILDPFKVLRNYDSFVMPNSKGGVGLNKDYVSTATFDHNYKKERYDSFIFGDSKSMFYQASDWKKHLNESSSCYHFDASGEGIFPLVQKIKYIDKKGVKINNALIIMDYLVLTQGHPKSDHMGIISPQLVNYSNLVNFHAAFFKAFISFNFFKAYFDYKISGKIKPYMTEGCLIVGIPSENDLITNETRFPEFEEQIANGQFYTEEKKKNIFFKRDTVQTFWPNGIAEKQQALLKEVFDIFTKHKTNYRIVISPTYDQKKLSEHDLNFLTNLFGKENVYDFSGINEITQDYHNYYEASHYRPQVTRKIMDIMYNNQQGSNGNVNANANQ